MLRLIDGWDVVFGDDQVQLKYPQSYITFIQQGGIAAPAGPPASSSPLDRGMLLFNTAFGEATFQRTFDQQQSWTVALDMQMAGVPSGGLYPAMEFLRISAGAVPSAAFLCTLYTNTNGTATVRIYNGTTANTIIATYTTTAALTANIWTHLDLAFTVFGSTSSMVLRFNGTIVLSQTGIGTGIGYPFPDTICPIRWEGFGPPGVAIDNLVIYDGQDNGDGFVSPSLMPQQRVTTVVATADVSGGNWGPFLSASSLSAEAVNPLRTAQTAMSDGDYATPNTASALQLFQMGTVPCYGLINAIALNLVTKAVPPIGSLPQISAVVREQVIVETMGVLTTLNLFPSSIDSDVRGYWILQAISAFSIMTGSNWVANGLNSGGFGMISDPSGIAERVSAIFLEVLTDVSGLPFSCGGAGNYSY
jgi:hypothetical protein